MPPSAEFTRRAFGPCAAAVAVVAVAAWAYYPTLLGLARVWRTEPNYSHAYLIPLLAAGLLAFRLWPGLPTAAPSLRWGGALLGAAALLRGAGAYFFVTPLDHASLLAALVGLCLLFGGRPWLARAWPALAMLAFTLPLPGSLDGGSLNGVLQAFATRASTFALETFGVVAAREGNVILLPTAELGVVEACSGLKMLMVFCALATLTAFLVPGGWLQKALIVVSAPPLAVACNVTRITVAGLASEWMGTETGYFVFHDLAGWLMTPLAFLLLGAEVYLLSKLVRPLPAGSDRAAAPGGAPPAPAAA